MVAAGSIILTSEGGMSMGQGKSSLWPATYCTSMGEADWLCSTSYSRATSKEAL